MGTPSFAAKILRVLSENNYNLLSVYTRPDKKNGRNQEIKKSEVKLSAEKLGLKIFQPERFDKTAIKELKKQKPDLIIVAAYGKILPKSVLEIPDFGAINVHASLLPKFRGPSPIQNAILNGEKETGTTIMLMNEGIDTGNILSQKKINIGSDEKYPELAEKIALLSCSLLLKTLPLWINGKIIPLPQSEKQATYCQLIERMDGKIIWTDNAEDIYNRYRALFPWPGVFVYWKKNGSNLRIKLHKINLIKTEDGNIKNHLIGEVFSLKDKIAVKSGKGAIILEEIQLEGKNSVKIGDFINGYPEFIGSFSE